MIPNSRCIVYIVNSQENSRNIVYYIINGSYAFFGIYLISIINETRWLWQCLYRVDLFEWNSVWSVLLHFFPYQLLNIFLYNAFQKLYENINFHVCIYSYVSRHMTLVARQINLLFIYTSDLHFKGCISLYAQQWR